MEFFPNVTSAEIISCGINCNPLCPLLFCRSDAASKLKLLHPGGWLGRQTVAVKVHFTLFSPAPNLFTSVTMLAEQSPTGVLLPSAKVQSARVYRTPAVWDYVIMVCQVKCYITVYLKYPTGNNLYDAQGYNAL